VVTSSRADEPHRTRRIVSALGTFAVVLLCLSAAVLIALAALARTDSAGISRIAGHPVLTVLSDSMTPTFKAGDLLVDRPASGPATGLKVGDAITFKTGADGQLITHRIIGVEQGATGISFRTQGDANNAPDAQLVSPEQVVGIYSTRIPYAGYALQAAHSRQGLFFLIVVPAAVLLLPTFRKWWRAAGESGPGQPAPSTHDLVTTGVHQGGRGDAAES
jgi:signal peptidase